MSNWKNRIKSNEMVKISELKAHPENWRIHPISQSAIVEKAVSELGWLKGVIVNKRTGRIIDGHLRVKLAEERGEDTIPVTYVELSDEEERRALIVLDKTPELATTDHEALSALFESSGDLPEWMKELAVVSSEELAVGPAAEPAELTPVTVLAPPNLTWVLIGIDTVRFNEIADSMERVSRVEGILFSSTVSNAR